MLHALRELLASRGVVPLINVDPLPLELLAVGVEVAALRC